MTNIITARGASKFLFLFFLSVLLVTISGLSPAKRFEHEELEREKEQKFHFFAKGLLELLPFKAFKHDLMDPPTTVFPTTPVVNPVTTPVNMSPDNSAPTVVTVPSTNPNTGTPNAGSTPVAVPSTTPVNPPGPITNPVTTPSTSTPVSNPVTTNPNPVGGVPSTTPVGGVPSTTPVTPPATTNAPATPGQSFCVAKNGAAETSLQSALDYACGKGADCSAIQQGGSCYNPNSLQNHASYAFNSYFQKNPTQTSCDFGGAAMITNSNPSTGSCVFPTSGSSTSSPATPTTTMPGTPAPTTGSTIGSAGPGSGATPTAPNGGDSGFGTMPSGFGDSIPPTATTSLSMSNSLQPLVGCIILVLSITTSKLVLEN